MSPDYARIKIIFQVCLLHLLVLTAIFIGFRLAAGQPVIPLLEEIDKWDVLWYKTIIDRGYFYDPQQQSNVAFFPLFPYLWETSGLNNYGISLFNLLVFYLSFGLLAYQYRFRISYAWLYLSVPSFMFMYIPYTEALFFLFSVLLLLSLRQRHLVFIAACLLVCATIRPVGTVFLPALIIMEILTSRHQKWVITLRNILIYCGGVLAGLGIVMFIQYQKTGTALGFIYSQSQWEHYFRLPQLPLSTWSPEKYILMMDGTALLLGAVAGLKLLQWFIAFLKKHLLLEDKALVFSALYLLGITFAILFFQGGSLHSLNRYFFCTAFFLIFFNYLIEEEKIEQKHIFWIFGGLILYWLLFKSYVKFGPFLKFFLGSVYLVAYLVLKLPNKKFHKIVWAGIYVVNVYLQIVLIQAFLKNSWVG